MENNTEPFAENTRSDHSENDTIVQQTVSEPAAGSPYPHGSARAMIAHMVQRKKEYQENAIREYEQNPEVRKRYEQLREKQKIADGK